MHIRHAQRQHFIYSLDTLLYQLHTLSFLLSPSIWAFLCRLTVQWQFCRPRELHASRTLRFWFFLIVLFNFGIVWTHAVRGAAQGRSIILDFVGIGHAPSKAHLLFLDFLIIGLEMLLTTVSYETSYLADMPSDTPDTLLPIPSTPTTLPTTSPDNSKESALPYMMDFRFSLIIDRLRQPHPPPPPRDSSASDLLPLPNTTLSQVTNNLNRLLRTRERLRERIRQLEAEAARTQEELDARDREEAEGRGGGNRDRPRRIPGAMDTEDET
ncbi:hypothetical protein CERSUDRAFT_114032 [Gelatoporia subvermispora B]|uniref:DUF1746 domain-containing protein n=1 Tax=Ceriporiopsis subvermispora (strain B) TaxID=914234 RepID=M2QK07_CERS8|nr:hypothetical protein CERSUDRAFT_114032 [Gelatoporia subvermispora B]